MKNKITIIVPVYNSEKYISRCIDSILNQSFKDYELLIINDGSKDGSLKIIKDYEKKDKRIKVIDQKNMGVAKTRNKGIKLASGEYIMFIDNDDYIENDYLKTYYDAIKDTDYDIVMGGYKRKDEDGNIVQQLAITKENEWSKYIVVAPWAKIYRKNFLIDNKIEYFSYKIGEDVYFNLIAYSNSKNIKVINNTDYIWFFNKESVSNTSQRGLNDEVDILVLLDKLIKKIDLNNKYNAYYIDRYTIWYLLFSGKQSTRDKFIKEYNRLEEWKKKIGIKKTISSLSFKLSSESIKPRFIVFVFKVISKLHLIKLFAKIYCKGDKNGKK